MHPAPPTVPWQAAWPRMVGAATTLRAAAAAGLQAALAAARGVEAVKDTVVERTQQVGEAAAKVGAAPVEIAREIRREIDAWWSGASRSLALGAALGVTTLFALVITSIALVVLLNERLGDPWGTLAVGGLYLLASALAFARIRATKQQARAKMQEHQQHARAIAASVPETLKGHADQ